MPGITSSGVDCLYPGDLTKHCAKFLRACLLDNGVRR
jgi:hypothetical protein